MKNINKFAVAVFLMEMGASGECLWKRHYKMAAVWALYGLSNLVLAFVKE